MATEPDQLTQAARERADKRIDQAIGELRAAGAALGSKYKLPENISGHSPEELLGRITYIPSQARELRRALALELTKQEISAVMETRQKPGKPEDPKGPVTRIEPSKLPDVMPVGLDLADLPGLTVQTVKALKAAGMATVGDVAVVPDQHLVKVPGMGDKSVAQLRVAIAKASTKAAPQ